MGTLKNSIRRSRAFRPLRTLYRSILKRDVLRDEKSMRALYSQFVKPGMLIFDVGANFGDHSHAFISMGARKVVAVEPNPTCARAIAPHSRLIIEITAVGETEGEGELHLGEWSGCSTLSTARRNTRGDWKGTIKTPITTLDVLAAKHGVPDFLKVDVEGFEDKVLAGMSFRPASVLFEFHMVDFANLSRCISLLTDYEFNYTRGERHVLESNQWRNAESLLEHLGQLPRKIGVYGDVVARSHA